MQVGTREKDSFVRVVRVVQIGQLGATSCGIV
jgi:hypothetical protein